MKFSELGIQSQELLKNIDSLGFENATEIQSEVIPLAIEGKDVSGLSRTGTGKTCAFLIPVIDRLLSLPPHTLALCLAPTRELAQQIEQEAKLLCQNTPVFPISVVGGMSTDEQIKEIKAGARLIIGTPGRVIDLLRNSHIDAKKVALLIFDEADRMFDMGFIDDMKFVLERINPNRQILLFSATMNFSVLNMMYEFRCNPVEINISKDKITAEGIQQTIYHISDEEKPAYLIKFCTEVANGSIIVFVNYKEKVYNITKLLNANGIPATGISSLLRQDKRNKVIENFRNNKCKALVATDIASRGLDIDDINLVVNYNLPEEAANYVHRIGRTARAGKSGMAISLAGPDDGYNQLRIEEFLGNKIPVGWLAQDTINFNIQSLDQMRGTSPMQRNNQNKRHEHKNTSSHSQGRRNHRDRNRDRDRDRDRDHDRNNDRDHRNHERSRDRNKDRNHERSHFQRNAHHTNHEVARPSLPFPITGRPVIYCTVTGKLKMNPTNSPKEYDDADKRINFLQKIGSTVSSIFSKK